MQKKTWLKILCNLDLFIASAALIVLTLVTSVGVFMRYILKMPILWQEEIQAFCQVWMVFLGGSVAFRTGSHVAIEILVDTLPEKAQRVIGYIIDAIVLIVLIYLAINCRAYIAQVFGRSNRPTPILRIPYAILYGVTPYSCVLMLISYFASKYAPKFVESVDIEASREDEYKEVG